MLVDFNNSKRRANENASEMIANGTIRIGIYSYIENWVVADCVYDMLLGMPCHVDERLHADHVERKVLVQDQLLRATTVARFSHLEVSNWQVKRFRRLLCRPKQGLEVFRVVEVCSSKMIPPAGAKADLLNEDDAELRALLTEFEEVFQKELPGVLSPKRVVDHAIEILPGSPTPHRPLYQL